MRAVRKYAMLVRYRNTLTSEMYRVFAHDHYPVALVYRRKREEAALGGKCPPGCCQFRPDSGHIQEALDESKPEVTHNPAIAEWNQERKGLLHPADARVI